MNSNKSVEEIVSIIEKKIFLILMQELPDPSCPLKKQQNEWKKNQVKETLSARLGFQSKSIEKK
jgi:hypothetical protein